ncbi:MAG: uncharacterized protein QOI11_667, partial [Candidatus Eremiobacteraeota bacterium]|nr:uncharacterized protein [Candidatus Eremiobacteraeota bacterium]
AGAAGAAGAALAGAGAARAGAADWCREVPLERSFCRALVVDAPKSALRLAVADTDPRREHGLMGVAAVPPGEGMLFVFPEAADQRRDFWMKDTIAPLDMVFVRADGTVSSVAARVPATKPGTPDSRVARRFGVGRYVIELTAGGAAAAGLRPGSRLALPALPAQ